MPKKTTPPEAPDAQEVEIIFAPDGQMLDLTQIATEIESTLDTIESHEGAFLDATLEHRLIVGLNVAKAMEAFALDNSEAGKLGGIAKAAKSRRDEAGEASESRRDSLGEDDKEPAEIDESTSPASFVQWLCKTSKRLEKPTAYKYAKAFRGLGLDHKATPEQVKMTLDTLRYSNQQAQLPAPNLANLIKAAPRLPKLAKPKLAEPEDSATTRLGDAREAVQGIVDAWDKLVAKGQLEDLEKKDLAALKEFLMTARDRITKRLKGL